ncbi:hypothetical protein K523DRAFT_417898 [Schizophyllum commune Tattone D]|nr:hypothetical protein K523DRAFT_417898 [Schizophyllum commune Tattone D]
MQIDGEGSAPPPSVARFLSMLQPPLPASLRNQMPSSVCPGIRNIYEERIRGVNECFAPDDSFSKDERSLIDSMLSAALHQAALLDRCSGDAEYPRIVSPEVLNMLFIILRHVFPDHELCTSALYAVARPPQTVPKRPVPCLYRRAEIIVRPIADESAEASATSQSSGSGSTSSSTDDDEDDSADEEDSDEDDEEDCTDDFDGTDEVDDIDEADSEDNASDNDRFRKREVIGTPQQLLYTGNLKPQCPALACVAQADELLSILTSALFHRRALGVKNPLVGICYEKTSTIVHIRIAWLEEALQEGNDLPRAHFVPHDTGDLVSEVDLSDPLKALGLALFLYRTSRAWEQYGNQAAEAHQWRWRADLEVETMLQHADYSRDDCISIWAARVFKETIGREIDVARGKMSPGDHRGSSISSDVSNESAEGPSNRKSTRLRSKTSQATQASLAASTEGNEDASNPSSIGPGEGLSQPVKARSKSRKRSSVQDSDDAKSFMSSSEYVQRTTNTQIPHTQRYFVTRGVIFCSAREGCPKWTEVPREFKHSTAFVWFYGDPTETVFRNICTAQERVAGLLHDAYLSQVHLVLGYMTKDVQKVVERSLCSVLQVVIMSRAVDARQDVVLEGEDLYARQVRNEATYRHQWDQLFHLIVINSGISNVGYEREAHLRYGEYDIDQTRSAANPLDNKIGRMFSVVHPGTTGIYDTAAMQQREYWQNGLKDGTDPSVEPLAGKADGILYLMIEDAYTTKTAAENVAIWAPQIVSESEQSETIVDPGDGEGSPKYAANAFAWSRDRAPISQEDRDAYRAVSGQASQQREPYDVRAAAATQAMATSSSTCTKPPCSGASCGCEHVEPFVYVPPAASTSRSDSSNLDAPLKSSDSRGSSSKTEGARIKTRNLYIPILACEFKRLLRRWTAGAATDQERLYLIAICIFIRLFNARFPVFGLVTSGPRGVISCAWNELIHVKIPGSDMNAAVDEHTPAIFIADQQAVQVDLRRPLDALNVATFVAYLLVVHAPRVRKLFEDLDRVDESVGEYILNKDLAATPLAIARSMKTGDGKWHKHKPSPKSTTKKGQATENGKEKGKGKGKTGSARNSPPSDLGSVPEENED